MALTTYADLQASVASWLKRSDLTANIPDLIKLSEARIARDLRVRAQIQFGTLTCTAGIGYAALPSDFLEIENITLQGDIDRSLTYETPEQLDVRFPRGAGNNRPAAYTIIGDRIYFGPVPDSGYTIQFTYYARLAELSAAGDTNWLLQKHPSVYLFAALAEAEPFTLNDGRAAMWEAKYRSDVQDLQTADDESLRSGSVIRVRTI